MSYTRFYLITLKKYAFTIDFFIYFEVHNISPFFNRQANYTFFRYQYHFWSSNTEDELFFPRTPFFIFFERLVFHWRYGNNCKSPAFFFVQFYMLAPSFIRISSIIKKKNGGWTTKHLLSFCYK